MLIKDLAAQCAADVQGGGAEREVTSAADIMSAQAHQATVLSDAKYKKYLLETQAAACFISDKLLSETAPPPDLALLVCADPEMAFLQAVKLLHPEPDYPRSISPHAALEADVQLGEDVHIGPFASIGAGSRIGDGVTIDAGARIGRGVVIGKHSRIYANAVIYDACVLGNEVLIHAGAVIGADGFGYKFRDNQHVKVPHVGHVEIADRVEIGANTCIDRGALGATRIGAGSKIDNLVQLGHNNVVGRNVIICGQSGISGSCNIGDGAILAGSSGLADHVNIGARATVMARSGISADVPAGAQVFGSPAKDRKIAWRELAALAKLPDLLQRFKELENRLRRLEGE